MRLFVLTLALAACERPDVKDDSATADDTGGQDSESPPDSDTNPDSNPPDSDSKPDTGESGDTVDTGVPDSGDSGVVDTDTADTGSEAGGDDGPGQEPDVDEPVAQPKWNRMIGGTDEGMRLDGRGSYDPGGAALTYRWSASDGTFDDDTSETPWYTGGDGTVTLEVVNGSQVSDPVYMTVEMNLTGARIPGDYDTVDDALAAGETILYLEAGTYGPISGADVIIGDPDGGVIIDAAGAANAVEGATYLRHLTITGAAEHGVYADGDMRIHDCVIEGNGTADVEGIDGGGLWSESRVVLYDSVIQGNYGFLGGGMYLAHAASLYAQQSVIADNQADYGGGIYLDTTTGNVLLQNSLVVGNAADVNGGGGVFLDSRAFLTRVTVADNEKGGIRLRYGYFEVDESIFAYNTVYGVDEADKPTVHFYDSLFGTSDIVSGGDAPDAADGNLSGDAVFLDFTAGDVWTDQDFALDASSPGVDVADTRDRDGSAGDLGALGGFLGRLPSGTQGAW